MPGQRGQLAIRYLVPEQDLPGQGCGVDDGPTGKAVLQGLARSAEEADVERRVVRHNHRSLGKSQERRQHLADARRVGHHLIGDPGEHRDQRRDVRSRVDEGLELAEHLTAPDLDRADLGDHVGLGAAGGLQIDDAERHLREVGTKIIEGGLNCHAARLSSGADSFSRSRPSEPQDPDFLPRLADGKALSARSVGSQDRARSTRRSRVSSRSRPSEPQDPDFLPRLADGEALSARSVGSQDRARSTRRSRRCACLIPLVPDARGWVCVLPVGQHFGASKSAAAFLYALMCGGAARQARSQTLSAWGTCVLAFRCMAAR